MSRYPWICLVLALLGRTQGRSTSHSSEENDSDSSSSSEDSDDRDLVCNALAIADTGAGTIFKVDIPTRTREDLGVSPTTASSSSFPVGVDIDPYLGLMFFSSGSVIYSSNVDGSNVEVLIDLGAGSFVEGLAVDTKRKKLFFTDSETPRIGYVHYPEPHTSDPVTVQLSEDVTLNVPRGIELDTDDKIIYWTDGGVFSEYLGRAEYDGSDAEVLVTGNSVFFNWDFTLDLDDDKLFWANAGVIESIDLESGDRHELLRQPDGFFLGIELVDDFLYITEPIEKLLKRIPKTGGTLETFGPDVYITPFNIAKMCEYHGDDSDSK